MNKRFYLFKNLWDTVILLLTVYTVIEAPLLVVFSIPSTGFFAMTDYIASFFYILDVLMIIYTVRKEKLLPKYDEKAENPDYLEKWIWSDVIASIPFDTILEIVFANHYRVFRAIRLLKLIRINSLPGFPGDTFVKIDPYQFHHCQNPSLQCDQSQYYAVAGFDFLGGSGVPFYLQWMGFSE